MGDVTREEMKNQTEKENKGKKRYKDIQEKFDRKMETPHIASMEKNWEAFKDFFKKDPQALLEKIDLSLNTAIHLASWSNDPNLLEELLNILPDPADRWCALRIGNGRQSTVLHQIINCSNVKMVDTILDYDKTLKPPEENKSMEDKGIPLEKRELPLLEQRNDLGETPVYRAAKYGKLKILKRMFKQYVEKDRMEKHFHRNDGTSIIHIAIIGQSFDVAVWLMSEVDGVDKLVNQLDGNDLTCLQLLSRMPSVFPSHTSHMESFKGLIYHLLPEQEYEASYNGKRGTDLESENDNTKPPSVFWRIIYAIWKFIAKEYDGIDLIWKTKKKHKLAEKLAYLLVEQDYSWQDSYNVKPREKVVLPVIQPTNIAAKKKSKLKKSKSNVKEEETEDKPIRSSVYTPLLLAASSGIVEIVEKTIENYPAPIHHVSPADGQNVLHVAVKHRQKKIIHVLKDYGALGRLASLVDKKNCTLLHQIARMDYYKGENKAGVVFQLQDELQWFERVMKVVPPPYILYCNDDELTARELFEIEHADMLKDARDWIKGTAQSCSAVAVLVATVVFAAAYTIPGGTDDNGIPIFLNSPLFLFFTVTDIVALASSVVSVMMFLSILTSPFEMKDFHKSLPRKLTFGFTLLFFSLTATMLAFGSAILLTTRMEKDKWNSSLIYSVTFFPVTLFGLMQFPIHMAAKYVVKRPWKSFKKVLRSRFTKSTIATKKRSYL